MALNANLNNSGASTAALAKRLVAMGRDQRYSDQDVKDAAISGLLEIVGELEQQLAVMKEADAAATRQATFDELQRRSYERGL